MSDRQATTPLRLDTKQIGRAAFLVKVPNYVAESWKAATQSGGAGTELARIRLAPKRSRDQMEAPTTDPTERQDAVADVPQPQKSTLGEDYVMQLTGGATANMPHLFQLQEQGRGTDALFAFQEGMQQTRVVATVQQRFDTAVLHDPAAGDANGGTLDPKYRAIARARNLAAAKKSRTMQVIEDPRNARMQASQPVNSKAQRAKPGEKVEWEHRARMDKGKLETRLFRMFEQQTHWKFAEIQKSTDQPAQYLKEVLNGIGFCNRQGPYMGNWQLKKEYILAKKAS